MGVVRTTLILVSLTMALMGCGLSIPQVTEGADLIDPNSTKHMEKQIKFAIYCELRDAIRIARRTYRTARSFRGKTVSTDEDRTLPDSWGAQVTMTFTVDESTKFNPGATIANATGSQAFGLGGTVSSQATRVDKYESFYTIKELAYTYSDNEICQRPPMRTLGTEDGLRSSSSAFTVLSELGIRDWLPQAFEVSDFLRSSRADENAVGPALGQPSFASDSISYDIKFMVVSELSATPIWKLVRVTTAASPGLLVLNRTRTHDLLITIGPGATETVPTKKGPVTRTFGLSLAAANSHLSLQIGNSVAAALQSVSVR